MNPFSGLQNPMLNRHDPLRHQSSGDAGAYGGLGEAPPVERGASGMVNCSQGGTIQMYWPAIFKESENTGLVEGLWWGEENGSDQKIDLKKKKKRRVQARKASKPRKKLNAVKGQWTPEEDW